MILVYLSVFYDFVSQCLKDYQDKKTFIYLFIFWNVCINESYWCCLLACSCECEILRDSKVQVKK